MSYSAYNKLSCKEIKTQRQQHVWKERDEDKQYIFVNDQKLDKALNSRRCTDVQLA